MQEKRSIMGLGESTPTWDYYTPVQWENGSNTPINAENLSKSEIALELILGSKDKGQGLLQDLYTELKNKIKDEAVKYDEEIIVDGGGPPELDTES